MKENGEQKKCPVDRGKLLIGLELCKFGSVDACQKCPYIRKGPCDVSSASDALAYIYYLEEQLGVTG